MTEIADTDEPVIDPETPREAHRVRDAENIDKEPDVTFQWERGEDKLDLYYGRIVARNFERVITWHVTEDNKLCHIDSEFAYNYADEQWEKTHSFSHYFDLTPDGNAVAYSPEATLIDYCQERVERCRELRFDAFDF
jgi:hypothetical protein